MAESSTNHGDSVVGVVLIREGCLREGEGERGGRNGQRSGRRGLEAVLEVQTLQSQLHWYALQSPQVTPPVYRQDTVQKLDTKNYGTVIMIKTSSVDFCLILDDKANVQKGWVYKTN